MAIAVELGGAILLIVGWRRGGRRAARALHAHRTFAGAHRFWEVDPAQVRNQMTTSEKPAIVRRFMYVAAVGPALSAWTAGRS